MNVQTGSHYTYLLQSRRVTKITIGSLVVLVGAGVMALLSQFGILPNDLQGLVPIFYILAALAFIVFVPMLFFQYGYARGGIWLEPEQIRVQYPGEEAQQMDWREARFGVDEGEIYLNASKGKEGYGHIFGDRRYLRLHLEGVMPEERRRFWYEVTERLDVRHPERLSLVTLLNSQGEMVARGRLYLFEERIVLAENRGERKVFLDAPLQALRQIQNEESFSMGRLSYDAFSFQYDGKKYLIMLGYELVMNSMLGSRSNWSRTGESSSWIASLKGEKAISTEGK